MAKIVVLLLLDELIRVESKELLLLARAQEFEIFFSYFFFHWLLDTIFICITYMTKTSYFNSLITVKSIPTYQSLR